MTVKEKVENFLKSVSGISSGYSELSFYHADEVTEGQVGYSVNPGGKTMVTGKRGDWRENWLAIGHNELTGEPLIVDMNRASLTVMATQRDEGNWETVVIADSLDSFVETLSLLQNISTGRTSPDELEENPIPEEERKQLLKDIQTKNPKTEIWYWENFLEN